MKKISLVFAVLLLSQIAIAQKKIIVSEENSDSIKRINEISLVVTDLIDGSYQFRYERKMGTHISIGLGAAVKSKDGLVSISGIDKKQIKTGDIVYSGFKLIPDVRYYLNKTQQYQLDGFYFGAYSKYFHFNSNINGTYINKSEKEYPINLDARIRILSLGLMVGYKLAVTKRLNIDFLILGPGTSRQKYRLDFREFLPDEFYDDLNEALKNFSVYDLIKSDFRFDVQDAKTQFTTISFRYGLTVGYTF
ncbi:DUF3575 domain-containing protein [Prolixibacteraceae bacterium Z1-6]|uniref:DUF3575 domain-containing protein n=1 Tax=Draconibacterium aestuarii TaxID=2998507 RepID=A0A9X3FFT4_9BACT|nr:DUF3575 domain-containing protein [Prolixibacteraceae bacterium Z1-6]